MKHQRMATKDQYIDSIFTKLPSNAIINKGRCGIGGTTLEIETNRDSIIVVPTIGVIDSKCKDYNGHVDESYKSNPKIFGIKGGVTKEMIIAMLEDKHPVKKIFTTPAGLKKLMECGYAQETILQNWFLLLDEYHTAATDAYRSDILIPFDYFWIFPKENRAMMSATPFLFSDPRFSELAVHEIKIKEKLGKIEIIDTKSVSDCLHYVLTNTNEFDGNLHIFFNTVIEIVDALRIAQALDVSIYVADSDENKKKLNEFKPNFHNKPSLSNYSKINFYTSRYFEGWDLQDKNPTVVLVTDTSITTTRLGIRNKAFQAVGRSRYPIDRIIHITNHRNNKEIKTFDEIQRQNSERAKSVVKAYSVHENQSVNESFEIDKLQKKAAEQYARINENNIAEYNHYLVDQFINLEYSNQDYNHIDNIKVAWNSMNYETKDVFFDAPPIPEISKASKDSFEVLKALGTYIELECKKEYYLVNRYDDIKEILSKNAPEWINAYHILGIAAIKSVKFMPSEIRKLMIQHHNLKQEPELIAEIKKSFPAKTYSLEVVKTTLYHIYEKFGIKDLNGKTRIGKKADLEQYFKIKPDAKTRIKEARAKYEAEFGKYIFPDESTRKLGFRVY